MTNNSSVPDPYDGNLNESSLGCFAEGVEGDMVECVTSDLFGASGSPAFVGLLMGATLLTSLYIAGDGDIVVPSVVMILFGSVLVPLLPPQFVPLAYSVVIIGVAAAMMVVFNRYVLRGGL